MAETLSSQIDGRIEGLKGREFIPNPNGPIFKIRRALDDLMVITGTTGGEQTAIAINLALPPEDDANRSKGLLSRLGNSQLGRIAAGITLAASAAVGACSPNADSPSPDQPPGLSTNQSPLTYDEVVDVGAGSQLPWSQWGDRSSNYGEMDGENYLFVGSSYGAEHENDVVYVKFKTIEELLSVDANVQTVDGLEAAGLNGSYGGPGVFQDQEGNNKFLVLPDNTVLVHACDITTNANGILEVSNCAELDPPMAYSPPSIFPKDGVPHALWETGANTKLRNLHTNVTENLPLNADWASSCGVGFEAGNVVVGAQKQVIQGVDYCRLGTAENWEKFGISPTALSTLNAGSDFNQSPRLVGENMIVWTRWDVVPPPLGDWSPVPHLAYVIIPPEVQPNPEPDAGVDAGSPDTGPSPDALANDIADAADSAVAAQPDTTPNNDATPPPDAGNPPNPDTLESPCDFAQAKVNITVGSCLLENCEDPFVDITGNCSFEVDLGAPNPVKLEIAGTYQVDLLEKIGALLSGEYKVWDNGNQFDTVTGNLITGVEGTIYRGQLEDNKYFVQCDEGKITVYLIGPNGEKTPLITLKGGEGYVFDMDNPVGPIFNTDAEIGQPDTETGQPEQSQDAGNPGKDTVGTDASTSGTDNGNTDTTSPNTDPSITPGADPGPAPDSSKPSADSSSDGSGCSIDTASTQANFFNNLSSIGLALLSVAGFIGAMRRRREKKY